jgi:hypothetical protein
LSISSADVGPIWRWHSPPEFRECPGGEFVRRYR